MARTRSLAVVCAASGLALIACGRHRQRRVRSRGDADAGTDTHTLQVGRAARGDGVSGPHTAADAADADQPPGPGGRATASRLEAASCPTPTTTATRWASATGSSATRALEGSSDRVACDYLATGIAENGRWGPTWFYRERELRARPVEVRRLSGQPVPDDRQGAGDLRGLRGRERARSRRAARAAARSTSSSRPVAARPPWGLWRSPAGIVYLPGVGAAVAARC